MKLYITGPVGSGKSTLARNLAARTGITCHALDNVVYEPDPDRPGDNRKRTAEERDRLFSEIIAAPQFIVEDAGRACFAEAMRIADHVVLLDFPRRIRNRRILLRWLKQRLGFEPCSYRPDLEILRSMFKWSRNYETGADNLRARLQEFSGKLVVLRTPREASRWLRSFPRA